MLAGFLYGFMSDKAQSADYSEDDFNRISPFNVRSLWLLRQVRYIIESYQVDADTEGSVYALCLTFTAQG